MTQHKSVDAGWTKGPWVVHDTIDGPLSNTDVRDTSLRWIARCAAMNGRPHVTLAESEANARLIAAAPALYEAVRLFLEYGFDTECSAADQVTWREVARAALSSARGES